MTRLSGALFVKTEDRDKKLFRNLDSTTIFMQNHKLTTGPQKVVDTIVWMNVECATQNMSI